jgi:hypothetical protein
MRSLAQQDVAEMGGRWSVLSRQKADHVELDRLLGCLAEAPPSGQPAVLLRIYRLVFPHAFAEEAVLWPAIRRVLPDGQELTLRVEQEHQQINQLVTRLEALEPGTPDHADVLARVVDLLRADVRDEEDLLLPRLQEKLSPAQLRSLGFAWEAVKRIAPTRAHPVVARRPPGNVLSALPLAILDRSRDHVEAALHRGRHARRALTKAGDALARTSRAVENLPGMDRGEDPSTHIPRRRSPWGVIALVAVAGAAVGAGLRAQRGGTARRPTEHAKEVR